MLWGNGRGRICVPQHLSCLCVCPAVSCLQARSELGESRSCITGNVRCPNDMHEEEEAREASMIKIRWTVASSRHISVSRDDRKIPSKNRRNFGMEATEKKEEKSTMLGSPASQLPTTGCWWFDARWRKWF